MLRKSTEIVRVTVSQEIREILGAEEGAPPGSYREVQILIPESPPTFVALGDARRQPNNLGLEAGLNRTYKLPPIPTGTTIVVRLLPEQTIWAAAKSQTSQMSLIIEYLPGDGAAHSLDGRLRVARRGTG